MAMNKKLSVFVISAEAIIYLLLYDLHDCTFNNFFYAMNQTVLPKTSSCFWKNIKVKSNIFANFAYASNYGETNTFVWKWNCAIFSELEMLGCWPIPYRKVLTNLCKGYDI